MDGNGSQQQVPHQLTTNYLPEYFPFSTAANSYMGSFRSGGDGGSLQSRSTLVYLRPPTTPSYQYNPTAELQNQPDGPDCQEGLLNGSELRSHLSVAGQHQGLPDAIIPPVTVGEYARDYVLDHRRHADTRPAMGSLKPIFTLGASLNESAYSRDAPPPFHNHASTSGGGGDESQLQAMDEFATSRLGSYSATNVNTFVPEDVLRGAGGDRRNPYANARVYRMQQHPDGILIFPGSGAGTTDAPEYARPSYPHSLRDEGTGGERHPAVAPPNFHSNRMPGQPSGARSSGKRQKARQASCLDRAVSGRGRTPKSKPYDFPGSTKQLPATPVIIRGPTCLIRVPQTWYETPARQDEWEEVAPIEFGGIKLTDAVNRARAGVQGYDDQVLDYKGVGGSVSCRINFPGREVGRSKILTTNHKNPREAITKEKLAFEVAKIVKRRIKNIKNEFGCADITFENLVLVRLVRVSRASWQPVLWYEVPAPGAGPS